MAALGDDISWVHCTNPVIKGTSSSSIPLCRAAGVSGLHRQSRGWLCHVVGVAGYGGRQPPVLTANKLVRIKKLPIGWASQREALGFPAA